MAIYIKVNNTEYPAEINGNPKDRSWDGRDTKTITLIANDNNDYAPFIQ